MPPRFLRFCKKLFRYKLFLIESQRYYRPAVRCGIGADVDFQIIADTFAKIQPDAGCLFVASAVISRKAVFENTRQVLFCYSDAGVLYAKNIFRFNIYFDGSVLGGFQCGGKQLLNDKGQPFFIRNNFNVGRRVLKSYSSADKFT